MEILSLALGIVLLLLVPLAPTTMGAIRSGFVFATMSAVMVALTSSKREKSKLATAGIVINIISIILHTLIAIAFTVAA